VLEHSRSVLLRAATGLALTPPLFLLLMAGKPWNVVVPLALLALVALAITYPTNPAEAPQTA
jgi:hypothetical protein